MCVIDFDWYAEIEEIVPWPDGEPCSSCGRHRVNPDQRVTHWAGPEYTGRPCPIAPRSVLGPFIYAEEGHGPDCDSCIDGEYVEWHHLYQCEHCRAADRPLHVWCGGDGYSVAGTVRQLIEHWDEDTAYRSLPFGRLIVLGRRQWADRDGRLVPLDRVRYLATAAVEAVA